MKVDCYCGALIKDQTDNLPHKAHLVPDQEWFSVFDAIDAIIEDAIAGRKDAEAASMRMREILITATRRMYQCRECGRLYVDDRQHDLYSFTPESVGTSKGILRSRDGENWDG